MRTVAINIIGVAAPGLPRRMVVSLEDGATVRSLLEEVSARGGDALRRAIWAEDGRVEEALLVALDGEVVDPGLLDARLPQTGDAAEVSLFLIRPIFGGSA